MVREQSVAEVAAIDQSAAGELVSLDELGSRIVGLAGRIASVKCRWLLLVAEFDRRDGCAKFGLGTTARWLAHYCSVSLRTAIEHVRVARSLAEFPALAAQMTAGRLTYSHVRAISRAVAAGQAQAVDDLIEVAQHGTISQLEVMVRGLRTVDANERIAEGGERPSEHVTHSWSEQAQWRQSARLDPERGAVVQHVVETIARAEGIDAAAALVRMAELALVSLNDSEHPPRPVRGDELAAVTVHVNAADLSGRRRPAGRIADGPGLPASVTARLMCIGRVRTVLYDAAGEILDLGRSHRVVSDRQFRALLIRHHGRCGHPGCGCRRGLEAHHVRHWLWGGHTNLANLVLLCQHHHHAHHDGEFSIVPRSRRRFRFIRADGTELPAHVDPGEYITTDHPVEAEHPWVSADAATSGWSGQRLDRAWAVSVLAQRRPVGRNRRPPQQLAAGA
jgi:hypothetical protein